jgi:hypothetical protein
MTGLSNNVEKIKSALEAIKLLGRALRKQDRLPINQLKTESKRFYRLLMV